MCTYGKSTRVSEGRKKQPPRRPVAIVQGREAGVPFECYYKRMDVARRIAAGCGGVLISLLDQSITRY